MATLTLNGIPAEIVSISESVDDDGPNAEVVYRCAYPDRWAFVDGLAGVTQTIGSPSTGTITRRIPHKYPNVVFTRSLYAAPGIKINPEGAIRSTTDGWADYGKTLNSVNLPGTAKITVPYKIPKFDYDPNAQAYFTEDLKGAGQFLTIPGAPFAFAGGEPSAGKPILADPGILIPQIDCSRQYVQVPYIDDRIFDMIGKVNSVTFRGQAAGLWLMAAVETHQEAHALGTSTFSFGVSLLFRPVSWNKIFSPYSGQWELVTPVVYGSYDFDSVFRQWVA